MAEVYLEFKVALLMRKGIAREDAVAIAKVEIALEARKSHKGS